MQKPNHMVEKIRERFDIDLRAWLAANYYSARIVLCIEHLLSMDRIARINSVIILLHADIPTKDITTWAAK